MVREIPGFQFDSNTGRYYAISRTGQAAGSTQQRFSHSAVEQQKRDKKQVTRPVKPIKKRCLARELYNETTRPYIPAERGILRRTLVLRQSLGRITERHVEGINIRYLSINHDDKWLLLAHDRGVSFMSFANGLEEMPHAYFAQVRQPVFYVEESRRFTLIGSGFQGGRDVAINVWRDDDLFCSLKMAGVPALVRPVGSNLVFVAQGRSVTFVDTLDKRWTLANGKRAGKDVWMFESDVIALATSLERVAVGLRNGTIYTATLSIKDRAFGEVEKVSTFDSPVTNLALVSSVHVIATYMNGCMKLYEIITQPLGEPAAFTLVSYAGYTNMTRTSHAFAVSTDLTTDGFVAVACDDAVVRVWAIWSGDLVAEITDFEAKFLCWTQTGLVAASDTRIRFVPLTTCNLGRREWPPDSCSKKWNRWMRSMVPLDAVL